mmetsp:Transcript_17422/g.24869  ORF Transcript_17422/g.24869 Transcript_17422/m.24869 type:complete len:645 (+) Transcript_17422:117-2051(+)
MMKLTVAILALTLCNATAKASQKKKIGITLNAGGNTAGNAMAGFMRGFQQQTVKINGEDRPALEAADYIAGSSGGSIVATIYHYQHSTTNDELLDAAGPNDPSQITNEVLDTIPENSMFPVFSAPVFPSLQIAIPVALATGKPFWPLAIQNLFLQPFGIEGGKPLSSTKIRDDVKTTPILLTSLVGPVEVFPFHLDSVINRDIYTEYNENVPMLEMVGEEDTEFHDIIDEINEVTGGGVTDVRLTDLNILRSLAEDNGFQLNLPAFGTATEFTIPLSGSVATLEYEGVENQTDAAEPFDIEGPLILTYEELSSEGNPFTLETLLGMSTDILSLNPGLRALLDSQSPFPVAGRPISASIPTVSGELREVAFTDGGINDLSGLPALIKMKPDRVITCFVPNPADAGLRFGPEVVSSISYQVYNLFGKNFGLVDAANPASIVSGRVLSHLFDLYSNGENQLVKLVDTFESLRDAGEPLVTTLEGLDVVDNEFWGIEGGWTVDVTFVLMVGVPQKFVDELPEDIAPPPAGRNKTELGFFTNEEFASVPNVIPLGRDEFIEIDGTFIPAFGFELPERPARMTQILTSWVVKRAWNGLVGIDGEVKFGGFRELFEEEEIEEPPTSGSRILNGTWITYFMALAATLLFFNA